MLAPSAYYPIYPIAAAQGPVPAAGLVFDVVGQPRHLAALQSLHEHPSIRQSANAHASDQHFVGRFLAGGAVQYVSDALHSLAHHFPIGDAAAHNFNAFVRAR